MTTFARLTDADADAMPTRTLDHLVLGIGASVGGMQALRFFEHLPVDSGMAFVVVIHLSPDPESQAAATLQRATQGPVHQVTEAVAIAPNNVYVIPPGQSLTMRDGKLLPQPLQRVSDINVAINTFFRVLAKEHGSRAVCAVCVVLSGTGSDGSVGLQPIKEMGGVTLVQSPDDVLHKGMPRAAIGSGLVDFVLPAAELPARLVRLVRLARNASDIRLPRDVVPGLGAESMQSPDEALATEAALGEIMLLLSRTRHDFRHYKIDARHRILHLSDGIAPFLRMVDGRPSTQLLDNLHSGLRLALRTALCPLGRQGSDGRTRDLAVLTTDDDGRVTSWKRGAVCGGQTPITAPPPAPSVLQGLQVLLVDDSVDSVESQAQWLALTGADVVAAHSGAEALSGLDRRHFDLLISDISRPGMGGLELFAAVRVAAR